MSSNSPLKKLPLSAAIAILASTAVAEETQQQETLEVWGTQVSSSSMYLGDEDIAFKQADHLSDLLRGIPGVEIGGTHSLVQELTIRGLNDTFLNISIDGARQNNDMFHHMGNLLINPDILKEVDIQVGNNSVVTGGLGGSVKFETKDAKDLLEPGQQIGGRIQTHFASNDSRNVSLTGYAQAGAFDVLAYGILNQQFNMQDGDGTEQIGNEGDIANGLIKFGLDIDEQQRLEFSYDKFNNEGDYTYRPDMGAATNILITGAGVAPTEYKRDTITLNYELDLGDALNLRATLYQNSTDLYRDEKNLNYVVTLPFPVTKDIKRGKSNNTGLNLLAETILDQGEISHELTYGFEYYKQTSEFEINTEASGYSGFVQTIDDEATNYSAYIEDRITFANDVALIPGVRYDRYKLNSANNSETHTEVSGALATEIPVSDSVTLLASHSQIFKGPDLPETFAQTSTSLTSNPNLQPEDGYNNEIGLVYSDDNVMGADNLTASVKVFRTRINNYIDQTKVDPSCSGSGCAQWEANVGTLDIDGFEISLNYNKDNFSGLLSYSRSDTEIQETNAPLAEEQGDTINLQLNYELPRYDVTLAWNSMYVREEDRVESGQEPKDGYDVHGISARWQPAGQWDGLTITAGIENLFDETYTSHASRIGSSNHPFFGNLRLNDYEPGRNLKLTAAYKF